MTRGKWIVFGVGCLSVLGYYLYFSYKHNSDPFVDISELSSGLFYCLLISSVLVVGFALLKIIMSFINICKEYENKIWRNKLLTNFSIFFVFCVFICKIFDLLSLIQQWIRCILCSTKQNPHYFRGDEHVHHVSYVHVFTHKGCKLM